MSTPGLSAALGGFGTNATATPFGWDSSATLQDYHTWTWPQRALFVTVVLVGYDMLHRVVPLVFESRVPHLPVKGKHLDVLDAKDWAFIIFNRLSGLMFVYHCLQV